MAGPRVILVSDTHLSASAPQAQANWDAVVSYVGACAADLVIHLGDLSLDGAGNVVDLRHGRTQLDRLPVNGAGGRNALPVLAAAGSRPARPPVRRH